MSGQEVLNKTKLSDSDRKTVFKFAKRMYRKYGNKDYSMSKVVRKAGKHKKEYGISNDQFNLFMEYYKHFVEGTIEKVPKFSFHTPFSKLLGMAHPSYVGVTGGKLKAGSDEDRSALSKIIKLAKNQRTSHAQAVTQSNMFDIIHNAGAISKLHNRLNLAHPLLVALFCGKQNTYVEERCIYSNMAELVNLRSHGQTPIFKSDVELLIDLTRSTNDMICNHKNLMHDLLQRCMIQGQLRECVMHLRSGNFCHPCNNTFLHMLSRCKMTNYDSPYSALLNDEGRMLRQLMEIFAMRPTKVATEAVIAYGGHDGDKSANIGKLGYMINPPAALPYGLRDIGEKGVCHVRIPQQSESRKGDIVLSKYFDNTEYYMFNGVLAPRKQQHIHNQGLLAFYVNRRKMDFDYQLKYTEVNSLSRSGIQKVNTTKVYISNKKDGESDLYNNINFGRSNDDETFNLASVVCVKENEGRIVGSYCYFKDTRDEWKKYDPLELVRKNDNAEAFTNITDINTEEPKIQQYGTIYLFKQNKKS